jgi:copper chaperone
MTTVEYHISNISCGHCVHTIESEIGDLEGVVSVNADQESRMVTIDYQPPADEGKIKELLTEINYPVSEN